MKVLPAATPAPRLATPWVVALGFLAAAPIGAANDIAGHYRAALERAPGVAAAALDLDAREARLSAARRWVRGEPRLDVSALSDSLHDDLGFSEQEFELGVSLWLPGERRAAENAAVAGVGETKAELDLARLLIAGRVRNGYWDAVLAGRLLEIERDLATRAVDSRDAVLRLVSIGEAPRTDAELAEAALAERQQAVVLATARLARATAALALDSGLTVVSGVGEVPRDDAAIPSDLDSHPEIRAARERQKRLAAEADRARRAFGASPQLGFIVRRERLVEQSPYEEVAGLRLSIPLGRDPDARSEAFERAAAARRADREADRARDRIEAELALARQAQQQARQVAELADRRSAALGRVLEGAERSYSEGETSYLDLLRARTAWLEARRQQVETHVAALRAHSMRLQVDGQLP